MRPRGLSWAIALVVVALSLSACGRATDVTVYEPGVYKGHEDPLLAAHGTPEHKELLKARFTRGQAQR